MKKRALVLGPSLAIVLAVGYLTVPTVQANAPTCCAGSDPTGCPGEYDKCCTVTGSTCSSTQVQQCVPCKDSSCAC